MKQISLSAKKENGKKQWWRPFNSCEFVSNCGPLLEERRIMTGLLSRNDNDQTSKKTSHVSSEKYIQQKQKGIINMTKMKKEAARGLLIFFINFCFVYSSNFDQIMECSWIYTRPAIIVITHFENDVDYFTARQIFFKEENFMHRTQWNKFLWWESYCRGMIFFF